MFLLVVLTACTSQTETKEAKLDTSQVSTPIDNDINNIDTENSDLNDNDLEGLDDDLSAIDSI